MNNLKELENKINYVFKDKNLLISAITHSSFNSKENYKKLAFLGDGVLEIIVTKYIYSKTNLKVGKMTTLRQNLVSKTMLNEVMEKNDLEKFVIFGESINKNNNLETFKKIYAEVFESILGAIFIDGGEDKAKKFVNKFILSNILEEDYLEDYKTKLQEYTQKLNADRPYYSDGEIVLDNGYKLWKIEVVYNKLKAIATGKTKKEAEQKCAKAILEKIK